MTSLGIKAAKYDIQNPQLNCRVLLQVLGRCFTFFTLRGQLVTQQKHLLQVEEMQRADWLICLVWIQDGGICCASSCEFYVKRATKPKFVAQSRPAHRDFSQQLLQPATNVFVARQVNHAR